MLEVLAWILLFGWPFMVIGVCWFLDVLGLWEPMHQRWKEGQKKELER